MSRLLKISWLNVKNTAYSKKFLLGVAVAFVYSMLWVFVVHLHDLEGYNFEFGRFLYVIILYATVSILRNDIRFNTTKTIFTGVFTRVDIMISKVVGLIIWGVIFFIIIEINNLLVSCILHEKIGIQGFLALNHLQLLITYVVITLTMGSLMLLIISLKFNDNKSILFFMLLFSMINFYTAGMSMMVIRHPEITEKVSIYLKTPFHNVEFLTHLFNIQSVVICLLWAAVFLIGSVLIINKREIK